MKVKHIYVFDVDNTLIQTTAKIRLVDGEGVVVRTFDSDYLDQRKTAPKLPPGTRYDFSEFFSPQQLYREPKLPLFQKLVQKTQNGRDCYILTAREGHGLISNWLHKNGVILLPDRIITNDQPRTPTPLWKKEKLKEIIRNSRDEQFDLLKIHVYDDSPNNQRAMASLDDKYWGTRILIHPVS